MELKAWVDDSNIIAYDTDFPKNIYWKPGGSDKFFTLRVEGFNGSSNHHKLSYHNPHNPIELSDKVYYNNGNVYRDREALCFAPDSGNPIIFHKTSLIEINQDEIVLLPTIRVKEYLLRSSSGTFIYTSYDKFQIDPRKFFHGMCKDPFPRTS